MTLEYLDSIFDSFMKSCKKLNIDFDSEFSPDFFVYYQHRGFPFKSSIETYRENNNRVLMIDLPTFEFDFKNFDKEQKTGESFWTRIATKGENVIGFLNNQMPNGKIVVRYSKDLKLFEMYTTSDGGDKICIVFHDEDI